MSERETDKKGNGNGVYSTDVMQFRLELRERENMGWNCKWDTLQN